MSPPSQTATFIFYSYYTRKPQEYQPFISEVITMPTILGLDLETYSSAPLPKCGVYRYCDAPDFEILLFSYAFDDAPVQTIDLAGGEHIPNDVLIALEDPPAAKTAYFLLIFHPGERWPILRPDWKRGASALRSSPISPMTKRKRQPTRKMKCLASDAGSEKKPTGRKL